MPSADDVYITPASQKIEWYDSSAVKGSVFYDTMFRVTGTAAVQLRGAADSVYITAAEHVYYDVGAGATYSHIWRDDTNGEVMRLSNGKLGIGTTSPARELHVAGDIIATNSVYFGDGNSPKLVKNGTNDIRFFTSGNSAAGTSVRAMLVGTSYGLDPADNSIYIMEKSSAGADTANFGQIWVKQETPNKLYFTDDAGTDHDLTAGGGGSPGGNNTELQYNNGGSFGGIDDLKWDGDKLLLGDNSDTGNYLLVEGSDSENTYTVFEGKRRFPRIRLTDTSANKTMDIWNLGSQLRFGSNAGSSTLAAMFVNHGTPSDGLTYGSVTMNSGVMIGTSNPINSSRVSIVDTQRPLTVAYDGTNYASFEVSSGGVLTIATNMANAGLTDRFLFDGNHFRGTDTNAPSMRNETPSATNPVFTFNNDVDTGMGRAAADELSLITAGTEAIRVDSSQNVGIGTTTPTSNLHVKGTLDIQSGQQTILMGGGNNSTARNDNALKLARVGLAHYHNSEEAVAMLYAASNGTDNTVVMGGGTSGMNAATRLQFATAENDATTAGTVRASIQGDSNYDKLFLGADTTLGFYRYNNRMDFYISSNPRMHLDASKLYSATSGGPLLDLTPTSGEANYGFVDDPDTGMSRTAANTLSFLAAGAEQLVITDNLLTLGDGVVLAPHASDNFTIDSPNGIILDGTSASNGVQYHDGGAEILRISNTNSNPVIRTMTDGLDMIFQQYDGEEVIRLTDSKNLDLPSNNAILFDNTNNNNQTFIRNGGSNAASLQFGVGTPSNANTKIHMDDNGHVGIGTTSPSHPLHVYGADNLLAQFESTDGIGEIRIADNTKYTRLLTVGNQFKIMPFDGVELMVLDGSTEKVGIGTASPSYELDVTSGHMNAARLYLNDANNYIMGDSENMYLRAHNDMYFNIDTPNDSTLRHFIWRTNTSSELMRLGEDGILEVKSGGKVGIGTAAPAAPLHISSTDAPQLRITSGSNTQCDFFVSQYGGLTLDVNHTLEFDVTRHMDYKVGSSRLHRFHVGGTQTLQHQLESGGGLLDFKGTQGKIWHAATPVAQIKDDVGIIMEGTQGIRNDVQSLSNFMIDAGTGINTVDLQGNSKIQNILLDPMFNPAGFPSATTLDVKLPVAIAGMEFIVTLGTHSMNLGNLTLRLIRNSSDTIYNGANAVTSISYTKNIGESIHVICFEANKWSVVAHV